MSGRAPVPAARLHRLRHPPEVVIELLGLCSCALKAGTRQTPRLATRDVVSSGEAAGTLAWGRTGVGRSPCEAARSAVRRGRGRVGGASGARPLVGFLRGPGWSST